MLYKSGRFLQLIGLVILPIAMAGNIEGSLGLGRMLMVAGLGVVVFLIGRWLQGSR